MNDIIPFALIKKYCDIKDRQLAIKDIMAYNQGVVYHLMAITSKLFDTSTLADLFFKLVDDIYQKFNLEVYFTIIESQLPIDILIPVYIIDRFKKTTYPLFIKKCLIVTSQHIGRYEYLVPDEILSEVKSMAICPISEIGYVLFISDDPFHFENNMDLTDLEELIAVFSYCLKSLLN